MCSPFTSSSYMVHLDLTVTHVDCHPENILVYFWAQYCNICELDYHILHTEIQNATKTSADIAVDEFCFAEDPYQGVWYRGRIIRKHEDAYEVFLLDVGAVLIVDAGHIAPASQNLFQLPPKIVCGVFSNIVPVRRIWSPMALKYFASLASSQIKGYVEDSLMNQIVLVEVPTVNQKLLELGVAKILDGNTFHFLLNISEDLLRYPGYKHSKIKRTNVECWRPVLDNTITLSSSFQHIVNVFSPSLQAGVIESVRITCASGLHNFYSQLQKLTSELETMMKDMHYYYENQEEDLNDEHLNNFGALCAAKGKDGKWYRGIVKQLLTSGQVEIWFVDFGNSAIVFPHHIKKLMPVFFMMPLMSFPCALTGLANQTKDWIHLQKEIFKQSLFDEGLHIRIDSYSCKEHLYFVTLCDPKNINIHQMTEKLSAIKQKTESVPKVIASKDTSKQFVTFSGTMISTTGNLASNAMHYSLRSAEMKVNASYVGFVEYVINPSDFWIRTSEYNHKFECLMNNIEVNNNKIDINEGLIQKPMAGLFCCARYSKDLHYYRAIITDVLDNCLKVFFVDFGNTEIVDFTAVKSLLPQYKHLPSLAMNCSIARVFPIEEVWTNDATDYFKKAVFNRELLIKVVSKQGNRYIVDVRDTQCMDQPSVSALMLQAGYADFWNVKADDNLPQQNHKLKYSGNKAIKLTKSETRICTDKNSKGNKLCVVPVSHTKLPTVMMKNSISNAPLTMSTQTQEFLVASPFRQKVFKLGSDLDVRVSHINSPAEFWCRLQSKSDQLELLMKSIQLYYSIPRETVQPKHTGCVAKCSKDGKWYRAAVIQRNIQEVTVLFVDYGIQQRTAMSNLCAINPTFLQLEGQAFRCTLNSKIQSQNKDPDVWDQVSSNTFKQIIANMLSSGMGLKCTILAMVLLDGKGLCNVVDLHAPYINVCQLLLDLGLATNVKSTFLFNSSIQLLTFCYSGHGIKIGSEEKVYITHASSLSKFYCQLENNTVVVDKLMTDVNFISKQIQEQKLDLSKTSLCLAKYFEDGQWYRALACSVQSPAHFRVFFIDYGNTEIVDKNDVVPIPLEAKELLSIPIQAVKCCLYLPVQKLPDDIITLFKETVMGKQLKAFVVAKKSDGQLVLDLYDGNVKITTKITDHLTGSERRCLDDERWQRTNFYLTNVVKFSEQMSKQPGYFVHLINETKGLISSFPRADLCHRGCKNKDQNSSLNIENAHHKRRDKSRTSKHGRQKIAPKYNLHPAKLRKACTIKNSSGTVHLDKTRYHVWKTKMILCVINSGEISTPTILCFPAQNIAALSDVKHSFEMVCRSRKRTPAKSFTQNSNRLSGMFGCGILEVDAASLSKKHTKLVHANDVTIILKDCLLDLDGWMNKMAFADMNVATAVNHYMPSKPLLSAASNMTCLSTLNLIACGLIQPTKEYCSFATSVIDPSEFYIQLYDTFDVMITLYSLLTELPEKFQALSLDSLNPGTTCLIKFVNDKQWYRAEICTMSQQVVHARAVDYGHYIFIQPSDFSKIRVLIKELPEIPCLTNPCSLNGVVPAIRDFWTDKAITFFQHSLNKPNLTVIFRRHFTELAWEEDLVINNKCVAVDLVDAGLAEFLKGIINFSTRCTFSSAEVFRTMTVPIFKRQFDKHGDLQIYQGISPSMRNMKLSV
ncbi:tudor domain-containing protein 15 [Amblyraja radiata]|uniref:tudor domain-containing protein 15 n=1 Tax=Amblyraja radiata TaxID=386614 RepID=UPI001401F52A|nr:tudor domain-containing protein 15 [Amblyraja radiata]